MRCALAVAVDESHARPATASIGFVAFGKYGAELRAHVIPLVLLGIGINIHQLGYSKRQGYKEVRSPSGRAPRLRQTPLYPRNYILDRIAAITIAAGAASEIAIRMWPS
jgi:hypothetical protein